MDFSENVKEWFKKAGWYAGRNIRGQYELPHNEYPAFVLDFLNEYANLKVDDSGRKGHIVNTVSTDPREGKYQAGMGDTFPYYEKLLRQRLFCLGAYYPGSYFIACDGAGRVYTFDDYCYYMGKNLYKGIENILLMNNRGSLQLDEDNGKWMDDYGNYVELP